MIVDGERAWEVCATTRASPSSRARSVPTGRGTDVAGYLIAQGYDVQLVNSMLDEAHGRPC